MTRKQFENLVLEAIEGLPKEFREKLENVDFAVEAWPTREQLVVSGLGPPRLGEAGPRTWLFGLYQGTPQPKRGSGLRLPDKITIFAGPILSINQTPEQIKAAVTRVVKHEIGHHFGLNEASIRRAGY